MNMEKQFSDNVYFTIPDRFMRLPDVSEPRTQKLKSYMYSESDLVKFGNYLLSQKRRDSIIHESSLTAVTDADIANSGIEKIPIIIPDMKDILGRLDSEFRKSYLSYPETGNPSEEMAIQTLKGAGFRHAIKIIREYL